MKKAILLACATFLASGIANGQIINVPGDQPTVQDAVNAAPSSGGEVVVAAGTYTGSIEVFNKSITIRGADPAARPVLVLEQIGSLTGPGFTAAGIIIAGDGATVTLSDLILIPSTTSTPDRMVYASPATTGSTITASFDNLLITGNNGSDQPSVTDPFDNATPLGTSYTSDAMYLAARSFGLSFLRDGIGNFSVTDTTIIGAGRDGLIAYVNGAPGVTEGSLLISGVAISRSVRNYIQCGNNNEQAGTLTITGDKANPGLLVTNHTDTGSPTVTGINGAGIVSIDHLVYLNNAAPFLISADNTAEVTISNSLIADNTTNDGLALLETGASNPAVVGIQDSTFFNNGDTGSNTAGLWLAGVEPTYTVERCIFAAASSNQGGVVVNTDAGPQATLTNNGLPNAGPNALTETVFGGGAGDVSETGSIAADPQLSGTTVTSIADLATAFLVNNTGDYAPNSVGGFGGIAGTTVHDWTLY